MNERKSYPFFQESTSGRQLLSIPRFCREMREQPQNLLRPPELVYNRGVFLNVLCRDQVHSSMLGSRLIN